jgi:hypothetical protein
MRLEEQSPRAIRPDPLVAFKLMHDEDGADQWSLG